MSYVGFGLIIVAFVIGTYSVTDYLVTRTIVSTNHAHLLDYVQVEAELHRKQHPDAREEYMRPLHLHRLEDAIVSSGGVSLWGINLFHGLGVAIVLFGVGYLLMSGTVHDRPETGLRCRRPVTRSRHIDRTDTTGGAQTATPAPP